MYERAGYRASGPRGWADSGDGAALGLATPVAVGLSVGLLLLSGMFSGLTLGLMGLEKNNLHVLAEGGEEQERKWARAILPIRERGNLLLCTLLLGNTLVNSLLSILTAGVLSGPVGAVVSTCIIMTFGEIIPQSLCTRFGLMIGANTIYVTKAFIFLLFPVAYPISVVLDAVLGKEVGNMYSADELKHFIAIHVNDPEGQKESGLTADDQRMISGVLDYKDRAVRDVMTTLDKVFMLEQSVKLNFENMLEIYKPGYTRIPVYDNNVNRIVGILFTKDLILVDPDDEIEIKTLMSFQGVNVKRVIDSTPLNEVFRMFKASNTHIMIAVSIPGSEGVMAVGGTPSVNFSLQAEMTVSGIITLEDVLEEVIKAEIVDESDMFESNMQDKRVARARKADIHRYYNLFSHRFRLAQRLSEAEVKAISAYLTHNVPAFHAVARDEAALRELILAAEIIDTAWPEARSTPTGESGASDLAAATGPKSRGAASTPVALYVAGKSSDFFTLIIQGKVVVTSGREKFPSQMPPWTTLGQRSLVQPMAEEYVPDFSASTSGHCRVVRIRRHQFHGLLQLQEQQLSPFQGGGRSYRGRLSASSMSPSSSYPNLERMQGGFAGEGEGGEMDLGSEPGQGQGGSGGGRGGGGGGGGAQSFREGAGTPGAGGITPFADERPALPPLNIVSSQLPEDGAAPLKLS